MKAWRAIARFRAKPTLISSEVSMAKKSGATEKRERLRQTHFKGAEAWTGEGDRGWFRASRTLPLLCTLIDSKRVSGDAHPSRVYVELLSRHVDGGIIEMTDEGIHAYCASYVGSRAVRTWQERMRILEENGFIISKQIGNKRYGLVLIVHPTVAVQRLREQGKVDDVWWDTYRNRQVEIKEDTYEDREKGKMAKVVPLEAGKAAVNQ